MKNRRLPALAIGGFLAVAAAFPVAAQGGALPAASGRLVGTVMAEDRVELTEALRVLEPALGDARNTLLQADLSLQQSEIDAAGILVRFLHAETAGREARRVVADAARELAAARDELGQLRAMPKSQENNAEIAGQEAEIAALRATVNGLETDLSRAKSGVRDSRAEADDSETDIAEAKTALDDARDTVAMVRAGITSARLAFQRERTDVEALVIHLTSAQLSTLNRSLDKGVPRELHVDMDAEHLRMILDYDYNTRQIEFLIKALVAEAKFLQIAVKTGNNGFREKAEQAKLPFLAMIDHIEAEKFDAQMGGTSVLQTASGPGAKQTEKTAAPIAKDDTAATRRPRPHAFGQGMLGIRQ